MFDLPDYITGRERDKFLELFRKRARGHLRTVHHAYRQVLGLSPEEPCDDNPFLATLEKSLAKTRWMRGPTKEEVSFHEAGHLVGFEACGMVADRAEIHGSPFGRDGWSGFASPLNPPVFERPQALVADDFVRYAYVLLAGPIAAELFGDGDTLDCIGELSAAAMYSDRAADLLNRDDVEMWYEVLLGAVALVEGHRYQILDVAAALRSRGRISRTDRPVEKILARVEEAPIEVGLVSERGLALARRITEALREFVQ